MDYNQLSDEWLELVKEFMESSVTKEEFRAFLESKRIEIGNKK